MADFSMDALAGEEMVDELFSSNEEPATSNTAEPDASVEETKEEPVNEHVDVDVDEVSELFGEEPKQPEAKPNADDKTSEGAESNDDNGEKQNPEGTESSIYSSFAEHLKESGVLTALPDDFEIKSTEDLVKAIQMQVESKYTESENVYNKALNEGVSPSAVQAHKNAMDALEGISVEELEQENKDGEDVRATLIYHAALARGMNEDEAKREVQKSFKAGTDIDDAKSALEYSKKVVNQRFADEYNKVKAEQERNAKNAEEAINKIRTDITNSNEGIWGDLTKAQREAVIKAGFETNITNKRTGQKVSELQMYSETNPSDFLKNISLCYALTDGFKNFSKLTGLSAKKETKARVSDFEKKLIKGNYQGGSGLNYRNNATPDDVDIFKL